MYKVIYLDNAKLDIHLIVNYMRNYSNDSPALKFIKKLYKESISISMFPYGGISYHYEKKNYFFRKTRVGKYIMFYIIDENNKEVLIFRVLHYRRNIDKILS